KLKLDFMIVWRRDNAISVYIGDRSKEINLLKIAEKFGGGGHPFACGFKIKLSFKSRLLNYITLRRMIPKEVKKVIETTIEIM
ncbi:MAG: DHHA1 domain-containing protein, partial [Candidatus Methanomethylicia archaeon]